MPTSPLRSEADRKIEMVDLIVQYQSIKTEIDDAIRSVIESGRFIKGPVVSEFERALADFLGVRHAMGVANGTDALQIAYMAAGVTPGSEVITTAFSFIATAEAALILGARPVFVDIEPTSFNIDVSAIEERITANTKAIVPVHLFGNPVDIDPILQLAERYNVTVIEDNAQAIGAEVGGRKTGGSGHMSCLSFFPSKNLGCYGDGGAVLTNDTEYAERVRMIANHGARQKYLNEIPGLNSRLDALQAAVLRVKLDHLEAFNAARIQAADRYDELLSDVGSIVLPERTAGKRHVFHQYTIRIPRTETMNRDRVQAHLREAGVPSAVYYPVPLHLLPVMKTYAGESPSLPVAEQATSEVLSLPIHSELTAKMQVYITDSLKKALAD